MKWRRVRGVLAVVIAACVVVLAFGVTLRALGLAGPLTRANVKRIRPGMARAKVEAILGGPGRRSFEYKRLEIFDEMHVYRWTGGRGDAEVYFSSSAGPEDRVLSASFWPRYTSNRRDPMRSLRAWVGR
jgi:hypothetical protein